MGAVASLPIRIGQPSGAAAEAADAGQNRVLQGGNRGKVRRKSNAVPDSNGGTGQD